MSYPRSCPCCYGGTMEEEEKVYRCRRCGHTEPREWHGDRETIYQHIRTTYKSELGRLFRNIKYDKIQICYQHCPKAPNGCASCFERWLNTPWEDEYGK